jgi:hypothetical protein
LNEREEENLKVEESNSASNEELLRRNDARALRKSLNGEEFVLSLRQEVGFAGLACVSRLRCCEPDEYKIPQASLELSLLG